MNNQWYETFFHGVALDMWRKVATPEMTKAEADFLVQALELTPGARVLDVPCGNGRHAIELASRGYNLTGVDLSSGFLEEARQSSAAIEWRQSDMRDLPWESAFDAAYCWGNSFAYFPHAEVPDFCRAVGRTLKPGARLVIDTGLAAEHRELLHRGGAAGVERCHQDFLVLALGEALGELGGGGGFARALQADHHDRDRGGRIEIDRIGVGAERRDQFVVHDLDDHLAGRDRLDDFDADRALLHLIDKGARHVERDVGLEQRAADLAQRRIDIGLRQRAAPRQAIEDAAKPFRQ